MATIDLRRSEAEFFFKSLFEHADIAVLTKNKRNNQPIIASADLAVRAAIAEERLALPLGNVWWQPLWIRRFFVERGCFVANISSGEQLACANWLDRFGDGNAVHVNWIADFEIANCKFVFGRNVRNEQVGIP